MDRAAAVRAEKMVERKECDGTGGGGEPGAAAAALQQCGQLQDLIDISLSSLQGLRTKCAASNDLTQQEIRTLEVKLVRYISIQRQCKLSVPLNDRTVELNSYPRFSDWLYLVNLRKEVIQRLPKELTLDALLEMNESKVKETVKRCGASAEECSRLNGALACLRKVTRSSKGFLSLCSLPQLRSVSVSAIPSSDSVPSGQGSSVYVDNLLESFAFPTHCGRLTLRTPHTITITPPTTPQLKRRHKLKPPRTPPPPSRKVFQLFPNFPTLTRSKSHESQLGIRIDEIPPGSPQTVRRDIGLSVTHRFSTKSWLSQVCHVCQKSMMFGVKCKHCRLKCHNKCIKEAPSCRISFLPIPKLRRTESVPSDINNPVDRPTEPQFGTLPKMLTKKDHPPAINHLDSSSNPSSTTSSTPSSPAPFQSSNPPSATPPPNPSPMGQRDSRFNFPGNPTVNRVFSPLANTQQAEEHEAKKSEPEDDEDEVDDLPSKQTHWRGMISRKASQTSVYLQEWDIPFEQIELGDPIGQGRWGKVYRGKWHGEVAIRLLEIDGNNQDHLKLFKKEVMNYRQTRHENVVLFMGACMNPPHLAIITR
uniref:Kinase suppressor of Ras 1 n=1 Tax=Sphenodon punctatus TaxID=8508 RepID=A0A8D0L1V3_SPHPU